MRAVHRPICLGRRAAGGPLAAMAHRLARAGFLACPERVPGRGQTVTRASSQSQLQGGTARAGAALDGGRVRPSLRGIDQDVSDMQRGERIKMPWCRRGDRRRDSSAQTPFSLTTQAANSTPRLPPRTTPSRTRRVSDRADWARRRRPTSPALTLTASPRVCGCKGALIGSVRGRWSSYARLLPSLTSASISMQASPADPKRRAASPMFASALAVAHCLPQIARAQSAQQKPQPPSVAPRFVLHASQFSLHPRSLAQLLITRC
jgi:hypothetical protein